MFVPFVGMDVGSPPRQEPLAAKVSLWLSGREEPGVEDYILPLPEYVDHGCETAIGQDIGLKRSHTL